MLQLFGHLEHVHFNVTWSACASKDASKQPKSTSNYLYYYSFFNYFNMMIFPTTEGYWVFIKIKVVYSQFCLELRKYKLNEKEHKAIYDWMLYGSMNMSLNFLKLEIIANTSSSAVENSSP